jgi:hypothetical protein
MTPSMAAISPSGTVGEVERCGAAPVGDLAAKLGAHDGESPT